MRQDRKWVDRCILRDDAVALIGFVLGVARGQWSPASWRTRLRKWEKVSNSGKLIGHLSCARSERGACGHRTQLVKEPHPPMRGMRAGFGRRGCRHLGEDMVSGKIRIGRPGGNADARRDGGRNGPCLAAQRSTRRPARAGLPWHAASCPCPWPPAPPHNVARGGPPVSVSRDTQHLPSVIPPLSSDGHQCLGLGHLPQTSANMPMPLPDRG
jgi:hypothetical protein